MRVKAGNEYSYYIEDALNSRSTQRLSFEPYELSLIDDVQDMIDEIGRAHV